MGWGLAVRVWCFSPVSVMMILIMGVLVLFLFRSVGVFCVYVWVKLSCVFGLTRLWYFWVEPVCVDDRLCLCFGFPVSASHVSVCVFGCQWLCYLFCSVSAFVCVCCS
jgi:hypothetical protein